MHDGHFAVSSGDHRREFLTLILIAEDLYKQTVGQGVAYHFFESYAKIDCNLTDRFEGNAKKRHLKAYEDLMYLLTERKALVEQYFCKQISGKVFRQLCNDLYHENTASAGTAFPVAASQSTEVNDIETHLPYSLGCSFLMKQ